MTLELRIGDVFDRLAEIPDGSIDLIVTSPPFLALRSYLPADHPDKHREIGSEATPADFLDTLLALSAESGRVLAPHGSLCVELGDTYAGSGGAGGDYALGGLREGQDKFSGSAYTARQDTKYPKVADAKATGGGITNLHGKVQGGGRGWPLAKSRTMIDTLYPACLAYGRNLLTGQPSPAGQWRIRNLIVWARPNPPVGALGDKFRPATSYITVACRDPRRYFDLDAVRGAPIEPEIVRVGAASAAESRGARGGSDCGNPDKLRPSGNAAGAPPLDWHADHHPEDGDWLWKLSTQPYSGWTPTVRRVPCGPDDGGERTTSPDCPRHADLPGQLPKALRDEYAGSRSRRTSRNGHHPEPTLDLAAADDGVSRDRSGSSPDPTSATTDPQCDSVAKPRSTPSRRTGHAPATTQPDTPSARTADDTARTSALLALSAPDLDNDESSTSPVDSDASREPQTVADTADIPRSERPCTCTFHKTITEHTSHYATFPMALPKRLIEAMCPLRVCTVCGRPSERIVDSQQTNHINGNNVKGADELTHRYAQRTDKVTTTLGWSDCGHDDWRTGIVLDPFAGSGTTLEAAQAVGRHAIGIDLDARNADLARSRVGMFLEIVV